MRTRKIKSEFTVTGILLLLIISCSGTDEGLKIKYKEFQQKDGNCEVDAFQNCVQIKFRYPEISFQVNPAIEKKINAEILEQILQPIFKPSENPTIEGMMKEFISDYNNFIIETGSSQGWVLTRDIEVRFFNDDFISIIYSEYSYLGGAHPNNFVLFSNYSLKSGNKIKLSDILADEYLPELTKIAEEEFRKLKNLNTTQTLNEAGYWFEDNLFYLNNNFALNDSTLTFYYNKYEISAYAYGPTELDIPLSRINHLLLTKGLLSKVDN